MTPKFLESLATSSFFSTGVLKANQILSVKFSRVLESTSELWKGERVIDMYFYR